MADAPTNAATLEDVLLFEAGQRDGAAKDAKLKRDLREFLRRVEDFGRLSGGQMKAKYDADPFEGYEWLAKQARALARRIGVIDRGEHEESGDGR